MALLSILITAYLSPRLLIIVSELQAGTWLTTFLSIFPFVVAMAIAIFVNYAWFLLAKYFDNKISTKIA